MVLWKEWQVCWLPCRTLPENWSKPKRWDRFFLSWCKEDNPSLISYTSIISIFTATKTMKNLTKSTSQPKEDCLCIMARTLMKYFKLNFQHHDSKRDTLNSGSDQNTFWVMARPFNINKELTTSIMAANGTKRRFAATTTLALPIMFLFAWSSGAWDSTIKHIKHIKSV